MERCRSVRGAKDNESEGNWGCAWRRGEGRKLGILRANHENLVEATARLTARLLNGSSDGVVLEKRLRDGLLAGLSLVRA